MPDPVKKRIRLINMIGAGGALAILAGTAALGVLPLCKAGTHDINGAVDLKTKITQLDALTLRIAEVQQTDKSRQARLADVEAKLPTTDAVNRFVPDIAKVAEGAGLQVDHVAPLHDPKDMGGAGDYKLMTVTLSGKGDFNTCYKFLTGLRGSENKLTRLDSLTLQVDRDKTIAKPVCSLSVDISTFMAR